MKLTRTDPFTGETVTRELDITDEQFNAWALGGLLIQDAFPHLGADDREWIKTGILPDSWERFLSPED